MKRFVFANPAIKKRGGHINFRQKTFITESDETTKKWVLDQYTDADYDINAHASLSTDFKSRLQELTQKHKLGAPLYELVLTTGPSHKPHFLVALKLNQIEKARAQAATKKTAEQRAAEILLTELIKVYHES